MSKQVIKRKGSKKNFRYELRGQAVKDEDTIKYIKGLKIPPAWKDVEIAKNTRSKILATGYDEAGRKQYIYHPREVEKREKAKYDRMIVFAKALPRIRRVTGQHIKRKKYDRKKILATIVRIIDQAYFRVGNEKYAEENNSYGITTLRSRHLKIQNDTLIFNFEGKSGQKHFKKIKDKQLAKILQQLDEMPGYEIFKYYNDNDELADVKNNDLNDYIREISGEDITAKDFRTWTGTLVAATALADSKPAGKNKKGARKQVTNAVKYAAACLGNTPAIARNSYIDPRIIDSYHKGQNIAESLRTIKRIKPYLSKEEACVLKMLEQNS